jgi:hypothetical protein
VLLGDDSTTRIFRTRKILTNTAGWEEKNPSRCATYSGFGKKPDIYQ